MRREFDRFAQTSERTGMETWSGSDEEKPAPDDVCLVNQIWAFIHHAIKL